MLEIVSGSTGSTALLTIKWFTGVTSEVNLRNPIK